VITAALLVTASVVGYKKLPKATGCPSLQFIIADRSERLYVTESELLQLLETEHLNPIGKPANSIALHRIEQTVENHPMVRTAECYLTPRAEVRVRLTQRVPLLHVQSPTGVFFIDTDRRVMQARAVVRDSVPVATGAISAQMASTRLADFVIWMNGDRYWWERIRRIHVSSSDKIYIILRGEHQPRVLLGDIKDYERKLRKLRTFLEDGVDATKDKHYSELDLRFKGQVIGRY